MPIFDIFSKRKALENGAVDDVFQYEVAPDKLRVQVHHIFSAAIGTDENYHDHYGTKATKAVFHFMVNALRKEYGVFRLGGVSKYEYDDERKEFLTYLLKCPTEQFLDLLEMGARMIENYCSDWHDHSEICKDAIEEINVRLRESGFGYQYESGRIFRVDTQFAHQQLTKPAIQILNAQHLKGAREEFLNAHSHYRERRYKECIAECLKSFESTMKAICARRNWEVNSNATAKVLIETCFSKGLIPNYMQAEFAALRALLESSIPTTRNRTSGHGQGSEPVSLPDHLAAFLLHQTASVLIFLDRSDATLA